MNLHEARLNVMLDPTSAGYCGTLNDEDRAAIRWLFDEAFKFKDELHAARQETIEILRKGTERKNAIDRAIEELRKTRNC